MSLKAGRPGIGLREVRYILLVSGEVAWVYAWALSIGLWFREVSGPMLALPTIGALLSSALLSARLLATRDRPHLLVRLATALFGLAAVSVVAIAELPAFWAGGPWPDLWSQLFETTRGSRVAQVAAFAAFVWWRGVELGRSRPTLDFVAHAFRNGIVAMAALLVMAGLAGKAFPVVPESLLLPTLGLLCAGLAGMSLACVVEMGEDSGGSGGVSSIPAASWLAILLGVVSGILATTALLAHLLSFDLIEATWDSLSGPVGGFLSAVVYAVALPFGLLVRLLIYLASFMPSGQARTRPPGDDLRWLEQMGQQAEPIRLSPEMVLALKVILAAAGAIAVAWLLVRALSRIGRRWREDGIEESRDFVWSWPGLRALWRWIVALLTRFGSRTFASTIRQQPEDESVRGLYRQFLRMGADIGRPRRPVETPLEYERRLQDDGALPGAEEIRSITEGYLRVRYASPASTPTDQRAVAAALALLRTVWRERFSR